MVVTMNFYDLHWTESNIEAISKDKRNMVVIASDVQHISSAETFKVKVTFVRVSAARRGVSEYIGDPKSSSGFKERISIQEYEFQGMENVKIYNLEGVTTFSPIAWIDLEVRAESTVVEVL